MKPMSAIPGFPIFEYLRVSITDRCNLRCQYCMPEQGIPKLSHNNILRYEEILDVVKAAVEEGVFRVRITGGEPLVRKGVSQFISRLATIPGIRDVSLTTNGTQLKAFARSLKDAGLQRVNISLDSLKPEKFQRITRGGQLKTVLDGIDSAILVGLNPVKLNVVLIPELNDDEIKDFADLAYQKAVEIRFIERMPFNDSSAEKPFITQEYIRKIIESTFVLEPHSEPTGGGPARMFHLSEGKGMIGFISPRTNPFCSSCNRLRLTANGYLLPCLDSGNGIFIRGMTIGKIREAIHELGEKKRSTQKSCAKFENKHCVSLSDIGG